MSYQASQVAPSPQPSGARWYEQQHGHGHKAMNELCRCRTCGRWTLATVMVWGPRGELRAVFCLACAPRRNV